MLVRSRNFVNRLPLVSRLTTRRPMRRLLLTMAGLALLLSLAIVSAMSVGAQSVYPANTVISTYFDARYGEVAVVTDASGNLIDINAVTGQRIFPIYPDYVSPYTGAYIAPAYVNANSYAYLNG